MKTPQQLSEEVLQKISVRKEKEKRIYRNVARVGAILLITAVIVPLSLLFNDNLLTNDLTANNGAEMNAAGNAPNNPSLKPDASFGGDIPSDEGFVGTTSASSTQKPDNDFQGGVGNDTTSENAPNQPEFSIEHEEEEKIESWEETETDSSSEDSSTETKDSMEDATN